MRISASETYIVGFGLSSGLRWALSVALLVVFGCSNSGIRPSAWSAVPVGVLLSLIA